MPQEQQGRKGRQLSAPQDLLQLLSLNSVLGGRPSLSPFRELLVAFSCEGRHQGVCLWECAWRSAPLPQALQLLQQLLRTKSAWFHFQLYMVKSRPPLQQSQLLHVPSGSFHPGTCLSWKHLTVLLMARWWWQEPGAGGRALWSDVTASCVPKRPLLWLLPCLVLQTTFLQHPSVTKISHNPQLLAGGFRICFFSLYLLMSFQIVQRCFWHSWLASRSSMKMTEISTLFLLLLDNQIAACLNLSLPMRDPRDTGQGLSKDFCGSRAGGKVPAQLAAATQAEGAAPSVYVYGRIRRHFQRERKAWSKRI